MTFDPTKPVRTRDGRKARILATDILGTTPVIAAVQSCEYPDKELIFGYNAQGRYHIDSDWENARDLVNIPERKERFMKIPTPSNAYEAWTRLQDSIEEASGQKGWVPASGTIKLVFEGENLVDVEILEKR